MNAVLDVFEVGDDRKGHDDQERPGAPFPDMNRRPRSDLVRISPDSEKRADILSKPNEKSDQHERQKQGHVSVAVERPENNGRSSI